MSLGQSDRKILKEHIHHKYNGDDFNSCFNDICYKCPILKHYRESIGAPIQLNYNNEPLRYCMYSRVQIKAIARDMLKKDILEKLLE